MISQKYIQEWKTHAPWPQPSQVEQDLIIGRALCELYSEPKIQEALAFRGGTALQKIFFDKPTRYSEDIDLVQIPREAFGDMIDLIRSKLDSWLGKPQIDRKTGRLTMRYRYQSEIEPVESMKLKIETNTGEHFSVMGYQRIPFKMDSEWYTGSCEITTFHVEEIMGTKLRALYQRRKGRDLYDFAKAFEHFNGLDDAKVVECFLKYMEYGGVKVSRAEFEQAIHDKRKDSAFRDDIEPLLTEGRSVFNPDKAFDDLLRRLIARLPGDPWKGKR